MPKNLYSRFLLVAFAAFLSLGAVVHAGNATVENTTPFEIRMAFKFYDYERKEWVVWGWYAVPPGTTKRFSFKIAPDRKIYWYGKTEDGKKYWPGNGDHGQSVIFKKMSGIKASVLKTYADSKVVKFKTADPSSEGNLRIKLTWSGR